MLFRSHLGHRAERDAAGRGGRHHGRRDRHRDAVESDHREFAERLGQPMIVDNKAGAGGIIGFDYIAKAVPDGHTLLVTTIAYAINAGMQKLPYDPINDFTPVTELVSIPLMLVVHSSLPVNSFQEFLAYAKAQPNGLDYATSGPGTSTHLAAEMLRSMTGVPLVHVPFKGNAEVLNALLGGHVKVHFALVASSLQHVKNGTLRALAVTTEKRLSSLPDVPTIAELGLPGYEISSWQAMFAPAGTPKDVVAKINGETTRMLAQPDVRERIAKEGADPVGSTPEQFSIRIRSEIEKWSRVIKDANIKMN